MVLLFSQPRTSVRVGREAAREVVGADEHRDRALEAARESMTLFSNHGELPLDADADVLVTGPNADDPIRQLGDWSVMDPEGTDIVTVRDGIEALLGAVPTPCDLTGEASAFSMAKAELELDWSPSHT